jgi:hypothetical protein
MEIFSAIIIKFLSYCGEIVVIIVAAKITKILDEKK